MMTSNNAFERPVGHRGPRLAAALSIAALVSGAAVAGQDAVSYRVVLTRAGKVVSSPTVVGEFGKVVRVDISQTMKVEAVASAPNADGASLTSVRLALFENGEMGPAKEMSMLADLSKTPSFEYSVPGTNARFVVVPRLARQGGRRAAAQPGR